MVQWIVCWSITIVHLVTVSVEDWMKAQRNAVVFTLTVMKTFNVSVIGKVVVTLCTILHSCIARQQKYERRSHIPKTLFMNLRFDRKSLQFSSFLCQCTDS